MTFGPPLGDVNIACQATIDVIMPVCKQLKMINAVVLEVGNIQCVTRDDGTSAAIASVNFIVNPNGLLYSDDGSIITAEDGSVSTYAATDINGETGDGGAGKNYLIAA